MKIEKQYIYVLYDPREPDNYRYCGFTNNQKKRLHDHIKQTIKYSEHIDWYKTHKINWINSLLKEGIKPEIKIIDEFLCDRKTIGEKEKYYGNKFLNEGHELTNTADFGFGGDTYTNNPNKEEIYQKMCVSNRNITPERIEKLKLKCSGWHQTEETKRIISEKNSGINNGMYGKKVIQTEETKRIISEKNSGINNGMYGKNTYNIWLEKYGKVIADQKQVNKFKKLYKPIEELDLNDNIIKEYESIKHAVEETGISRGSIGNCLIGRSKTAGNFKWRYKGDIL